MGREGVLEVVKWKSRFMESWSLWSPGTTGLCLRAELFCSIKYTIAFSVVLEDAWVTVGSPFREEKLSSFVPCICAVQKYACKYFEVLPSKLIFSTLKILLAVFKKSGMILITLEILPIVQDCKTSVHRWEKIDQIHLQLLKCLQSLYQGILSAVSVSKSMIPKQRVLLPAVVLFTFVRFSRHHAFLFRRQS